MLSSCLKTIFMQRRHFASKCSVFLNFRGKDTRHSFVRPLHKALYSQGISAFKDDSNLNKGDWIRKELFRAIEACRIAIIVLSKNYATSAWCLDELVKIMKYKHSITIFPVFYDVCPSDVRHLRGSFAQALIQHEINHKIGPKKVKIWKQALRGTAEISGFDLLNDVYKGNRSKCIQDIVQEVRRKLKAIRREEHKSVPAIEYHQTILKSMLRMGSSEDLLFMRIWGSNKSNTTIFIRKNFNKYCDHFEFKFGQQVSNSKKQGMDWEKRVKFEIRQRQCKDYAQSRQIVCAHQHLALSTESLSYRNLHPLTCFVGSGCGWPLRLGIQHLGEEKKQGMVRLQKKFLENISKRRNTTNMIQGMRMIEPNFCLKKVINIFDGVNSIHRLHTSTRSCDWFGRAVK